MNKKIYLKITDDMCAELKKRADRQGVPRAGIIKQILYEGLKNDP